MKLGKFFFKKSPVLLGLICKYKGHTADAKFNKFDNALSLIDKIKEGEISLANAKKLCACSKLLRRRIKFDKSFWFYK